MKIQKKDLSILLILLVILCFGFVFRMFLVNHIQYSNLHLGTGYTHDEYNYIHMVKYLFTHHIYSYFSNEPDALVPPGYPFFLALVFHFYETGEQGIYAVKLIQAVLSTLSILLTYLLSFQLTKKRMGSLIAALLVAFYPALMLYSRFILTETLYIFFILLYFNLQIYAFKKERIGCHSIAGLVFGISIMIRPMIAIFALLPYVYYFIVSPKKKKILKDAVAFFVPVFCIMAPWIIRNSIVLGRFIPLASQTNPIYAGLAEDLSMLPGYDSGFLGCCKMLFQMIFQYPIETFKWFFYKKVNIIFGWSAYWLPDGVNYFIPLNNLFHIFIMGNGLVGLFLSLVSKKMQMIGIYITFYALLSLLFVPNSRFGLQYVPFLCVFAGYLIDFSFEKSLKS